MYKRDINVLFKKGYLTFAKVYKQSIFTVTSIWSSEASSFRGVFRISDMVWRRGAETLKATILIM